MSPTQIIVFVAFVGTLKLALELWGWVFRLIRDRLIADDPAPTSSYPSVPASKAQAPGEFVPLSTCPDCGITAYHLFTPHASVSQCGYDVKMIGRECVIPQCGTAWAEVAGRVIHQLPDAMEESLA